MTCRCMRRPDAELVAIDWISADGYFAAVDRQLDWVKMGVMDTGVFTGACRLSPGVTAKWNDSQSMVRSFFTMTPISSSREPTSLQSEATSVHRISGVRRTDHVKTASAVVTRPARTYNR